MNIQIEGEEVTTIQKMMVLAGEFAQYHTECMMLGHNTEEYKHASMMRGERVKELIKALEIFV